MIGALDVSQSAMVAQRIRLDVIANNMANADATAQEDGTVVPFRRRYVTFQRGDGRGGPGVHVGELREDPSPFERRYNPGHQHAGPDGYVQFPNVDLSMEYVDALAASRAYEANAAMMGVTRGMLQRAIQLFA
jgi:flagellar basal-body rod protein FlgC